MDHNNLEVSSQDVERILTELGPVKRWQVISFIVYNTGMMLPQCLQILSVLFIGESENTEFPVNFAVGFITNRPFDVFLYTEHRM